MSASEIVHVSLGERSYDIVLGQDLIANAAAAINPWLAEKGLGKGTARGVVIADRNVSGHARVVANHLQAAGWDISVAEVDPGEASKNLGMASRLYDALVQLKTDRKTAIIAVGGGVIGDLAGFVAATFNRGLPFIQIPTTLLADVDSSVGGKVGINHPSAKNLIGAFHQPFGVLIDTDCLKTLPRREYRSGLAEVVKYGVILDADFFGWLEQNAEALLEQQPGPLRHAIARSCQLKAMVVEQDEFERTGLRAALNYGHTYAHAFEALAGYGELLHGEAVSIGMVCASRLAERLGRIPAEMTARQIELLKRCELPVAIPENLKVRGPELVECMRLDKKSVAGKLRFVLPTKLGHVELVEGIDEAEVLAVIEAC
ncbi:3-dehydroquinate synthase [Caulifigura coniformis]|uniref:3-dehydroquinate synthase n=1 Tax=Caulifigura coniformis TaxID=2527983 RepID=A0A517S9M4_9PLAN|nr:3-dehydroquinate synthase [Caulifigura coniformis]QDT52827.1 3-dehydroquinate synthase [Caulifigura coniformis]